MAEADPKVAARLDAVRRGVLDHFLSTGEGADTPTLAKRLGWAESKVRKVINDDAHGAVSGTVSMVEERPSYSKSYRSVQQGSHRVTCWYPGRAYLREVIITERTEAAEVKVKLAAARASLDELPIGGTE